MLDQNESWKGEHLIRTKVTAEKEHIPGSGRNPTDKMLADRRKKMKKLIKTNMSRKEIAQELGISLSALYSDLQRLESGKF